MPNGNFIVYYDQKRYVNITQAKRLFNLKENDLVSLLVSNVLKTKVILGRTFVEVETSAVNNIINNKDVTLQDLDSALAALKKAGDNDRHDYVIDQRKGVYKLDGITFVAFNKLNIPQKYNHIDKIPHVKVCGNLYAAIDYVNKDGTSYLLRNEEREV